MTDGRNSARSYQDLRAWQRAMDLAAECEVVSRRLRSRSATLSKQLQRASISVPLNIAEGCGRRTRADFLRHLSVANGSLLEVETILLLALRFGTLRELEAKAALELTAEVGRILAGLIRSLQPVTTGH
ncbi:MAG: four helix bundle protein [Anaerolineae bacterium]|nr:four helix bundle protein [Gemmatimonadaceae bacterium]